MRRRLLLGFACFLLGSALLWSGWGERAREEPAPRPGAARLDSSEAAPGTPERTRDVAGRQETADDALLLAEQAEDPTASTSARHLVHGTLVDEQGRPLGGLELRAGPGEPSVRTDADGRFRVRTRDPHHRLVPRSVDWALLEASRSLETGALLLVAGRTGVLDGRVVDAEGRPLALRLRASLEPGALSAAGPRADGLPRSGRGGSSWSVTARADGHFSFARVPVDVPLVLEWDHDQHQRVLASLAAGERPFLQLVVDRDPTVRIAGIVLEDDGRPVPGACLALGAQNWRSDEDGRFEVDVPQSREPRTLTASSAHGGEVRVARVEDALAPASDGDVDRIDGLEVRLSPPRPLVRGRLLDADGLPLPGWRVRRLHASEPHSATRALTDRLAEHVFTQADGSFVVRGLPSEEESVVLEAWSKRTRVVALSPPYAPGTSGVDWVLTIPASAPLAGVLESPSGAPVVRATIRLAPILDGRRGRTTASVRSDLDGSFRIDAAPRQPFELSIQASGFLPRTLELADPLELPSPLLLTPAARLVLRAPPEGSQPYALRLQDPSGKALSFHDGIRGHDLGTRPLLEPGARRSFEVSVEAAVLLLESASGTSRRALQLTPGGPPVEVLF